VLSPHLFAIYVNDIISRFNNNQRMFIVLYADDILLIAPSVTELQNLLNFSQLELAWLDLCINVKKMCCMRIGNRFESTCTNIISLD
jgi:hypothetical protein